MVYILQGQGTKEIEMVGQGLRRLLLASSLILVGCATGAPETRLQSRLSGADFNSISSSYASRPTWVALTTGAMPSLMVTMSPYDRWDPVLKMELDHTIQFDARYVDEYLAMCEKFLDWEKLAVERGDMIDREIGRAATIGNFGATVEIKFFFHSGNAQEHYLVLDQCFGACVERPINFSKANVMELMRLLGDQKAGRLKPLDVDSVYN